MKNYNENIKINNFLNFYKNYLLLYKKDDNNIEKNIITIEKFMNKMVNWYNLRFPDYEIDGEIKILNGYKEENRCNILINGKPLVNNIKWHDYLNKDVFISILSDNEKQLLKEPIYKSVDLEPLKKTIFSIFSDASLYVKKDGIIYLSYNINEWSNNIINNDELEGKHLIDAYKLFKKKGIKLNKGNNLEKELTRFSLDFKLQKEMLNCTLYKIISKKDIYSVIRGIIFANEFGLDKSIPISILDEINEKKIEVLFNSNNNQLILKK